jgi:hypothetical protein
MEYIRCCRCIIEISGYCVTLIRGMKQELHTGTAKRFEQMLPEITKLKGKDNFLKRQEMFSAHWNDWYNNAQCQWLGAHANYPTCGCPLFSFDRYCEDFDTASATGGTFEKLLVTRKMMYIMLSCNQYFGMDGIIYSADGIAVGPEYLAINTAVCTSNTEFNEKIVDKNSKIEFIYISEIPRFNHT